MNGVHEAWDTTIPCQRAKWENGKMGRRELLKRRLATNASLYKAEGGLADMAGSAAIPATANVEAGQRTVKLDGVIGRYI
jgi:hypothetical protein